MSPRMAWPGGGGTDLHEPPYGVGVLTCISPRMAWPSGGGTDLHESPYGVGVLTCMSPRMAWPGGGGTDLHEPPYGMAGWWGDDPLGPGPRSIVCEHVDVGGSDCHSQEE